MRDCDRELRIHEAPSRVGFDRIRQRIDRVVLIARLGEILARRLEGNNGRVGEMLLEALEIIGIRQHPNTRFGKRQHGFQTAELVATMVPDDEGGGHVEIRARELHFPRPRGGDTESAHHHVDLAGVESGGDP